MTNRPAAEGQISQPQWANVLVAGFGASIALWIAWFLTHLPWLNLSERVALPLILLVWVSAAVFSFGSLRGPGYLLRGILAGVVSAAVGLLILGSKLTHPPASGRGAAEGLVPHAGLIAAGFLAVGAVVGLIASQLRVALFSTHRSVPRVADRGPLARAAIVVVLAAAPLLIIGGLVTSTNSGMAVPDWPNTYGSNMFLYPLGPRAAPDVYLEHSHRLFGTLLGVSSILLLIVAIATRASARMRVMSAVLLGLVIVQGVLGAIRVIHNDRVNGIIHGVLAQIVLALAVEIAAALSRGAEDALTAPAPSQGARQARRLATFAYHSIFLQLIFGAVYRHLRSLHALWSHAGFAMIVMITSLLGGFSVRKYAASLDRTRPLARALRACSTLAIVLVVFQFLLGWATFSMGGRGHDPAGIGQALLRTGHHAAGAALLAVLAWQCSLTRRLPRA